MISSLRESLSAQAKRGLLIIDRGLLIKHNAQKKSYYYYYYIAGYSLHRASYMYELTDNESRGLL